jgi:hypothetical protein
MFKCPGPYVENLLLIVEVCIWGICWRPYKPTSSEDKSASKKLMRKSIKANTPSKTIKKNQENIWIWRMSSKVEAKFWRDQASPRLWSGSDKHCTFLKSLLLRLIHLSSCSRTSTSLTFSKHFVSVALNALCKHAHSQRCS